MFDFMSPPTIYGERAIMANRSDERHRSARAWWGSLIVVTLVMSGVLLTVISIFTGKL